MSPNEEPSTMTKIITDKTNSKIVSVGLDLAKSSFSPHAFDEAGNTRKRNATLS
jgi:hypothetical protein